jgi:hypothetical protein
MKLYKYNSYDEYVAKQVRANLRKLERVSAHGDVAALISKYVIENIPKAKFGICHGVRNAIEVKWFRKLLGFNIIGTEISHTANMFKHTIQWDFHDVRNEWLKNVDFIYSNSLDHSYNPEYCVSQWIRCLSNIGMCFIEWNIMCEVPDNGLMAMEADCFRASLDEYRELLCKYIVDELKIRLKTKWIEDRGRIDDRTIFVLEK